MCEILPKKGDVISVCPCKIDNDMVELNLLDDTISKELMNEWGISFRSNSKDSDYNSDIND